jgi:predicted nucleotide-binding protein (sugar kinase/HSP70/actin superfamily)
MSHPTVGIPRALLYHKYHVYWETLLKELNYQVVVSPPTNKSILDKGLSLTVDESCLAVKIFLGHVDYLVQKDVDYLFIPHMVSHHQNESVCVKFMGLVDMVRNTFDDVRLIRPTTDKTRNTHEEVELIKSFLPLKKDPLSVHRAHTKAKQAERTYKQKKLDAQHNLIANRKPDSPTVLIVSHPYTTYDQLLGIAISKYLRGMGVQILYSDVVEEEKARKLAPNLSQDIYWTYNIEQIGAIEYYRKHLDGIIFLMSFPCGPDSLVVNLCQQKIQDIPILVLSLDELQGEAGLKTRLESFIDILAFKMQKKRGQKHVQAVKEEE